MSKSEDFRSKAAQFGQLEAQGGAAIDVIRGRWKPMILWELNGGAKRFSDLQTAMPEIAAQVLTIQLRQLEADGVKAFADSAAALRKHIETKVSAAGAGGRANGAGRLAPAGRRRVARTRGHEHRR